MMVNQAYVTYIDYLKNILTTQPESMREQTGDIYTGPRLPDGSPHGKGKMEFANGKVYDGEWVKGKMHGQGKDVWPDGDVYEGEHAEDKKHGQGKYIWPDGDVYEGEWAEGKAHGQGKYVWSNGKVYEGEWAENKWHGQGKLTEPIKDGLMIKEGHFEDDKLSECKRIILDIEGEQLEVATKDLDGGNEDNEYDWDDAMRASKDLGKGWRLPTKHELNILYKNKKKIGGFSSDDYSKYWSSIESDDEEDDRSCAWFQFFHNGIQMDSSKDFTKRVRCVRSLNN